MNLFARFLGGWLADRFGSIGGMRARIGWLAAVLLAEGILLVGFGMVDTIAVAVFVLLTLGLFVKMGNGANYAIVPLVHQGNLGAVAGIVGAGGNLGAVAAGFMFRAPTEEWPAVLQTIGVCVIACATIPLIMAMRERPAERAGEAQVGLEPTS